MSNRDNRYTIIEPMIAAGRIVTFTDIFKFIPKTVVANDMGKKVDRFNELMARVEKFTLEDLYIIARFCAIEEATILELANNEYLKRKGRSPKTKKEEPE